MLIPKIDILNYTYELPDLFIASHPLPVRDASRLLFYNQGRISHHSFYQIPDLLPTDSLLIANESRVIPARITLHKPSGAKIEIFLLEPAHSVHFENALSSTDSVEWNVLVGNKKKWKSEETLFWPFGTIQWINREEDRVCFKWTNRIDFATVIDQLGDTPIPPYIKRATTAEDKTQYQTVYAQEKGSVAAPTAGLHFTPDLIKRIEHAGHQVRYLTLHVGAGTFKPVSVSDASKHIMHTEHIRFSRSLIELLVHNKKPIIPVGTTSLRSLESLYWFGVGLLTNTLDSFDIPQFFPYQSHPEITKTEALQAVLDYMTKQSCVELSGRTALFIIPGYKFRLITGLITNFHQPGSTLLLLVAALLGDDWKDVYSQALKYTYRFLSFGDASLLLPKK